MELTSYITGIGHIGLPTRDMNATLEFYEGLGFSIDWKIEKEGAILLAFLKLGDCVFETFVNPNAAGVPGAIDHLALSVSDVDSVYRLITESGRYQVIEPGKRVQSPAVL